MLWKIIGCTLGFLCLFVATDVSVDFDIFVNLPSFLLVVGGSLSFTLSVHAPTDIKEALRTSLKTGPVESEASFRYDTILGTLGNTALASGVIAMIIGLVQMLTQLDNPRVMGPAIGTAALAPLYAAIISGALHTLRQSLRQRTQTPEPRKSGGGPSNVMPDAFAVLGSLLISSTLLLLPFFFKD